MHIYPKQIEELRLNLDTSPVVYSGNESYVRVLDESLNENGLIDNIVRFEKMDLDNDPRHFCKASDFSIANQIANGTLSPTASKPISQSSLELTDSFRSNFNKLQSSIEFAKTKLSSISQTTVNTSSDE